MYRTAAPPRIIPPIVDAGATRAPPFAEKLIGNVVGPRHPSALTALTPHKMRVIGQSSVRQDSVTVLFLGVQ